MFLIKNGDLNPECFMDASQGWWSFTIHRHRFPGHSKAPCKALLLWLRGKKFQY